MIRLVVGRHNLYQTKYKLQTTENIIYFCNYLFMFVCDSLSEYGCYVFQARMQITKEIFYYVLYYVGVDSNGNKTINRELNTMNS